MSKYQGRTVADRLGFTNDRWCHRCDGQIDDYRDAIKQRGKWIHKRCASGGDDR